MKSGNSTRVTPGTDNIYRWTYEINLFKNFSFFFLVWKILLFISLGIFAVVIIADIKLGAEVLLKNLKVLLVFLAGMTALTMLGYFIYAGVCGGKYTVEFEMDENGILHRQADAQAKKAKKLGGVTATAGLISGRPTAVGVGINAQRTEMYSEFQKVKRVKAYSRKELIKVNGTLNHNRVYVGKEDFEFVKNFIISHCTNLK